MEKVKFKNSRNKILAGILYQSTSDKAIIMCHGYTSDKSMEGRTEALANKLTLSGFNCFAFDFSGCGESEDDSLSLTKEVEDLNSAVKFINSLGYKKIAFYGHSLGALICLMAYKPEIITMVLSAPLTDTIIDELKIAYPQELFNELREKGQITLEIKKVLRNSIVIDKMMIDDFQELNQKEILSKVKCPLLLIHGNAGSEEPQLLAKTQRGIKYLTSINKLEIVNSAGHNFENHIDTLTQLTVDWFQKYFQ